MRSWQRCSGLLLAVVAVALVWPVSAGGQFGYVTTHGISMEPRFHTGDLAVVHPVSEYRVGDITAYHNRMLHTIVLHRIVAIDGDRYTFKGDNNSWLDQERPVRSQLIGTLVLRVPHGGVWLRRLISPPALGLAAFALLATGAAASRRRRRKRRMSRHAASRRRTHTATAARENVRPVAAVAAVVVTSALAALAWTHPETRLLQHNVVQSNSISLSYTANVKPTPVYDSTTVSAPTPVFRNVTDTVALHFRYQGAPAKLRLDATLTTPGGWTSTVPLASTRAPGPERAHRQRHHVSNRKSPDASLVEPAASPRQRARCAPAHPEPARGRVAGRGCAPCHREVPRLPHGSRRDPAALGRTAARRPADAHPSRSASRRRTRIRVLGPAGPAVRATRPALDT
jgi:signal peptidase I